MLFAKSQAAMILVNLTQADEIMAARVGLERVETSRLKGYENSYTISTATNYFGHVMANSGAVAAEIAVAKALGFDDFKPTCNTFKSIADVGADIEVRWTAWLGGTLIVHPKDRDSDIAVLVVGMSPNMRVIGWIPISAAKRPKYRHSKDDAWWVSQINLHPIETLMRSQYAPSI